MDLMSRGGLYLGKAGTLNVDLNRIYRVLTEDAKNKLMVDIIQPLASKTLQY